MENRIQKWLKTNWNYIKEIQERAKTDGCITFGEIKNYIKRHFRNLGTTFEPSILILCCDDYKDYKNLSK